MEFIGIVKPDGTFIDYKSTPDNDTIDDMVVKLANNLYNEHFTYLEDAENFLLDTRHLVIYPNEIKHKFIIDSKVTPLTEQQLQFLIDTLDKIDNTQKIKIENILRTDKDYNNLIKNIRGVTIENEFNNQNSSESFIHQFKRLAEHRIDRYNKRIVGYETRKDNLNNHGYWSLGYFEGRKSILEELLDELNYIIK